MTSVAAVRRFVDAARALAGERDLALALVESTGLSREGVELALANHLETDPTDDELARLVAGAEPVSRVTVILAANVFVGALRAVAVARAAAPEVVVRPSRRDPTFARALVTRAGDPGVTLEDEVDVASVSEGEIHVYGRDETIADVRARARVPVRGHGSGMGLALVSPAAEIEVAARALAADVVAFDQRGCLSPRLALVEGSDERASDFLEAIHAELDRVEPLVPRGAMPADERAASARWVSTMTIASRALVGRAHAVALSPEGAPLLLPPPYRHVAVAPVRSLAAAAEAARPLARGVAIVGSDELARAGALATALGLRVRTAALGRMQRPPLDGPVDLRG